MGKIKDISLMVGVFSCFFTVFIAVITGVYAIHKAFIIGDLKAEVLTEFVSHKDLQNTIHPIEIRTQYISEAVREIKEDVKHIKKALK